MMRRFRPFALITVCLALLIFSGICYSQIVIDIEKEEDGTGRGPTEIDKTRWEATYSTREVLNLWFTRKAFLEGGNEKEAAEKLNEIKNMAEERVINEMDVIGGALLFEGYEQIKSGNYERALATLSRAKEFDSSLYQVHFARAGTHFKRNKFNPIPYLLEFPRGVFARFGSFWSLFTTTSNIYIILYGALLLTGFLIIIVGGIKYFPVLKHEYQERFPKSISVHIAGVIASAIIFLPLLLWLDPVWLFLFWIILYWRYFKLLERCTAVILLILLLMMIPSLKLVDRLYASTYNDFVRASISAATGNFDLESLDAMEKKIEKAPGDTQIRFLAALLYRNGGYYDPAKEHLEVVLKKNPRHFKALVNMGNLHFLSQDPYVAVKYYKEALNIERESASVYYNMSRAYDSAFRFDASQEMMEKAKSYDPGIAAEISKSQSPGVIDMHPDAGEIITRFLVSEKQEPAKGSLELSMFFNVYSLIIIATIVLIFVNKLIYSRYPKAFRCNKCGRAFCEKCKIARESDVYCSQCEHLYIKKDGVSPDTKMKKMYEIEKHGKWQGIAKTVFNVLFPGSGFSFVDKNLLGIPLIFMSAGGLLLILLENRLITYSKGIVPDIQFPVFTIGIVLAGLSWLVANPLSWWKRY